MNAIPFAIGFVRDNYRIALWMAIGALLCWPLAYCTGKRDAKIAGAAKVEAASYKVSRAASQAELAATLAEKAREAKTTEQMTELRKAVSDAKDDGAVGPAVSGVLAKLRGRDRGQGGAGAR